MNKILFFIILCLPFSAYAAGQRPERIVVRGDTLLLFTLPLESMDSVRRAELQKRLARIGSVPTPASQRGYCGLWRVDKDSLRLDGIFDANCKQEVPIDSLLRKGQAATWFSGELRVADPEDKTILFLPEGFEHYFKSEGAFTIVDGARKKTQYYSNRMVGDRKVFYEQTIPAISNAFVFPPLTDSTVYKTVYVAFSATPNKLGKITHFDQAKMVLYKDDGAREVVMDAFHPYLRELLRRLELAEPYGLSLRGKMQPITLGIELKTRQNTKKRP